jgi:Cu(I)/Ag(I) efflux system membrane fusion protein
MKSVFLIKRIQPFLKIFTLLISFSFIGCVSNTSKKQGNTLSLVDTFTCAMHPQIIRNEAGNCPVCGMKLVKKENAGREVSQVDLSALLKPTNTFVISQIPVTTIKRTVKPITIDALGRVDYDTRYVSSISARVSGRIEKLYVRYRYEHIHKGYPGYGYL